MQSVFCFRPIYQERPWGGHAIGRWGGHKDCPAGKKIGEAWEISDRQNDESIISNGEFEGKSIRWLLDHHGMFVMGRAWERGRRFPLLIKILDAAHRMSLQVHPPPEIAKTLGGEPKTEMWYLLDAQPRAGLVAGLKRNVTREDFEKALREEKLDPLLHHVPVKQGDALHIPSGRIHAIGGGCLIFEVQQNSDTTYRVYDWGHVGLDGKPRPLHVEQSLKCIDFDDYEPGLLQPAEVHTSDCRRSRTLFKNAILPGNVNRLLVSSEHFTVIWHHERRDRRTFHDMTNLDGPVVMHILNGGMEISGEHGESVHVEKGDTVLLAATVHKIHPHETGAECLIVLEKE